mmetsp:Transcript_4181/g.10851  ORF Transcript_4181/g.10851 Transcript_4181/m.10851 type:complete len:239 (+) Transcript_4181:1240-1956(+)
MGSQSVQSLLHTALGNCVECRGGLVQYHERWILQQAPRYRRSLLFATAQLEAAITNDCVPAICHALDKIEELGVPGGLFEIFLGGPTPTISNVLANCIIEHARRLGNHTDASAERLLRYRSNIFAVYLHSSAQNIIKAKEQTRNCRLSGTCWADNGGSCSPSHFERNSFQSLRRRLCGIMEVHVVKFYGDVFIFFVCLRQDHSIRPVGDVGILCQKLRKVCQVYNRHDDGIVHGSQIV